ncbi:hypothetical protein B4U79_17885 [Dinothrombium tinctorium]|uniref:RING-type domain-containing protein n=1 Tax=Dinothrombium tinctorium TaxID=1965070 RepID=A0A443RLI6_9ACAR|nr:hypothetical protein B4U79_17885 [Dinothrombium tinctorium]
MGFDVERIVNFNPESNEDLICCICSGVFDNPISTICEHIFCIECIAEWMRTNPVTCRCPQCNSPLDSDSLITVPRMLRNMLNNLHIQCENRDCNAIVKLEDLRAHLNECTAKRNVSENTPLLSSPNNSGRGNSKRTMPTHNESRRGRRNRQSNTNQNVTRVNPSTNTTRIQISRETVPERRARCCSSFKKFCSWFFWSLSIVASLAVFLFLSIVGIIHFHNCKISPSIPKLLVAIGISGSFATFFNLAKQLCFRENKCRIVHISSAVCFVSILVLLGFVWNLGLIMSFHSIYLTDTCNPMVIGCAMWLINSLLLSICLVLAICLLILIVIILFYVIKVSYITKKEQKVVSCVRCLFSVVYIELEKKDR